MEDESIEKDNIRNDIIDDNNINIFQDFESPDSYDLQKYELESLMNPSTIDGNPFVSFEKLRDRGLKKKYDKNLVEDFMDGIFNKICVRKDLFLIAFSQPTQNDPLITLEEIRSKTKLQKVKSSKDYILTDNLFKAACQSFILPQDQCSI